MILREAYIEVHEEKYKREIEKEQQRRNSWEISEEEYDRRYNRIMDDRRLRIMSLLPKV